MTTQAPHILDHDRFQAAVKAARDHFAMLKAKHLALKGYLVLTIPGKQTGIGSGAKEILGDLPALIVDDAAKRISASRKASMMCSLNEQEAATLRESMAGSPR